MFLCGLSYLEHQSKNQYERLAQFYPESFLEQARESFLRQKGEFRICQFFRYIDKGKEFAMTDREAKILKDLIRYCSIYQVGLDDWEVSFYGADNLYRDEDLVHQFGSALLEDDLSETRWFYSVQQAIDYVNVELRLQCPISVVPLPPDEIAQLDVQFEEQFLQQQTSLQGQSATPC